MESAKNTSKSDSAGNIEVSGELLSPTSQDGTQLNIPCTNSYQQQLEDYLRQRPSVLSSPPITSEPLSSISKIQAYKIHIKKVLEKEIKTLSDKKLNYLIFKDVKDNFATMLDISSSFDLKMGLAYQDLVELDKKMGTLQKSSEEVMNKLEADVESLETTVGNLQADVNGFKTSFANIEGVLKRIAEKLETQDQPGQSETTQDQLERKDSSIHIPIAAKRKGKGGEEEVPRATKQVKVVEDPVLADLSSTPPLEKRQRSVKSKKNQETQAEQGGPMMTQVCNSTLNRTSPRKPQAHIAHTRKGCF